MPEPAPVWNATWTTAGSRGRLYSLFTTVKEVGRRRGARTGKTRTRRGINKLENVGTQQCVGGHEISWALMVEDNYRVGERV